ncbi:DUF1777-domain-containing protein [Schizopora paradoxa]|uniref:DUF1777-domain-containing protein n=1 Tax=Schizopora paradoxa TaxID=27342 RepID=A0A0H2S9I6_9AGAM|nr:DUF1777-domain-containing protein [Schizopora paradoxa]
MVGILKRQETIGAEETAAGRKKGEEEGLGTTTEIATEEAAADDRVALLADGVVREARHDGETIAETGGVRAHIIYPREHERRDRDDRRPPRDGERPRERSRDRERDGFRDKDRRDKPRDERDRRPDLGDDRSRRDSDRDGRTSKVNSVEPAGAPGPSKSQGAPLTRRVDLDPDSAEPEEGEEEGEEMDVVDEEAAAMQAMMGFGGFGTTKNQHVTGNPEGGVNIKKMRTWRQYMNRRGGFHRPLDKIK